MEGRLLAGRYRLESVVGRGAMGTVWRARDETLGRDVAIKEVVLLDGLSDEERANRHRRTLREARASAALSHPGVVTVHDVVDEDDRPWIVMELVRARSLQEILDEGGPLPPARAAEIGRQIAGALRAAHAMGVLHRDVKPANVLVAEDDRAVLTDFGIAQLAGDATLTGTGLLIGSPAYMAPERVNGDPAIPASDMWALGATLYAATEGRAPHHRGDAVAVLAAIVTKDVPPPRNAGPLAPVLAGLLERDPARRLTGDRAEEALKAVASGRTADGLVPGADTTTGTTAGTAPAGAGAGSVPAAHPAQPVPPYAATPYAATPHPPPGPVPGTTAQYPPSAAPEPPGEEGRARSVVVPILAGAAMAAVILAVAGVLLWPDGSSGGGEGPQAKPTTVAKQSTPGPGDTPTSPGTEPASAEPASTGDPDGTLPAGLVPARGPGFTIGVPRGWKRSARGASVFWTDPASSAYVQVDGTPWSGDPYEHWLVWERQAAADGRLKDFERLSITRTRVGDEPAADIEFTWTRSDGLTRARDRGVIAGGRSYAVVVALPAARWNENEALVKNVLDTFRPSGVG